VISGKLIVLLYATNVGDLAKITSLYESNVAYLDTLSKFKPVYPLVSLTLLKKFEI